MRLAILPAEIIKFPLVFVFLVLVPGNVLGKYANFRDDLTYDDLVRTNVTCAYSQTCKNEVEDPSQKRTCTCDSDCSLFGTCCIDSPYIGNSAPVVECRKVGPSKSYFLVSRCPPEVGEDSVWKDLCEKEWEGEDDMMKLAPVTSLDTLVAYKNYYCFRCHEDVDKFRSWHLRILGDSVDKNITSDDLSFTYDKERQRWIATAGDGSVFDNIIYEFLFPADLPVRPKKCEFDLVSDCDDSWTDEDTREKCGAYAAIVYSKYKRSVSFKNPHCALCNFEPVENIVCLPLAFAGAKQFSFPDLININRDDKCGDNQLWDPYAKQCKELACAIPGYVLKEGRCTRP